MTQDLGMGRRRFFSILSLTNRALGKLDYIRSHFHHFLISGILFSVLLISAFIPVPQIVLLYLNGGFFGLFINSELDDGNNLWLALNIFGSFISMFFYYFSSKLALRIITALLSIFFLNALVLLGFFEYFNELDQYQYWVMQLINALIIGIILILIDILRLFFKGK